MADEPTTIPPAESIPAEQAQNEPIVSEPPTSPPPEPTPEPAPEPIPTPPPETPVEAPVEPPPSIPESFEPELPQIPQTPVPEPEPETIRPESPSLAEPPPAEPKPPESSKPPETPQQPQPVSPSPSPSIPPNPTPPEPIPEIPVVETPIVPPIIDISSQISQALKDEQNSRRVLANQARKKQKDDRLNKIMEFVRDHGPITNDQTRDLLHVSQSTATGYLKELSNRGMLNIEGKGNATKYH